jgi:hypothetical protein
MDAENKKYLFFTHIINTTIAVLPSQIIPNKGAYPRQEALIELFHSFGYSDTSDSLYLFAYISFWWFGVILYPLFFVIIWYFLLKILNNNKSYPIPVLAIISQASFTYFYLPEGDLILWLSLMRNGLLFLLMYFFIKART